jgi:dihydropyrimidinase
MYDLRLINAKAYIDGAFQKTNIYIDQQLGQIKKISDERYDAKKTIDCTDQLVLPGFIDPHVHFQLSVGEFTSRDDFVNGSKIAALGGVTTFIDFLDPIAYTDDLTKALIKRTNEAKGSYVDYSFHITLGNFKGDINQLIDRAIAEALPTIKIFTTYSESDRRCDDETIKMLINAIADQPLMLLVHAEAEALLEKPWLLEDYERSRPTVAEITAIESIIKLLKNYESKVYIVHTTSGKTIHTLQEKVEGLLNKKLFFESCPQYFYLSKDKYQQDNGNLYLMAPPLRSIEEQKLLRENIDKIFSIGTDHCSFTKADKNKYVEVSKIPKGVGSIEYSFALMYHLFGNEIIDKFTVNPAKVFGLYPNKGAIQEGTDADLVIFDPNYTFVVDQGHSKADYSPYEGIQLQGKVKTTLLKGDVIVNQFEFVDHEPKGQLIRRQL